MPEQRVVLIYLAGALLAIGVAIGVLSTPKAHGAEACDTSTLADNLKYLVGHGAEVSVYSGEDGQKVFATVQNLLGPAPDNAKDTDTVVFAHTPASVVSTFGFFTDDCLTTTGHVSREAEQEIVSEALGEGL